MAAVLKDAISRSLLPAALKPPRLPLRSETSKIAEQLERQEGNVPSPKDLEEIYGNFLRALDEDNWRLLTSKDWKSAPHLLWFGERLLATESKFRSHYYAMLKQEQRASRWKSLIKSYFIHFGHSRKHPEVYREIHAWVMQGLQHPQCSIWRERNERFRLFDPSFEVTAVITYFLENAEKGWNNFAGDLGFSGQLATSEYLEYVGSALIKRLQKDVVKYPAIARKTLRFFADNDSDEFRFSTLQSRFMESILSPWSRGKPPEEYQKYWRDWLLTRLGDPRLPIHRNAEWRGVSETALGVMRQWLVGETIKQFFEIIDHLALEHQWLYRKAFWSVYLDAGEIADAHVILGKKAYDYARETYGTQATFWKLEGIQDNTQSVLLLRMRELTFAVWSHNGRCRAWNSGDKNCPAMARELSKPYTAYELRTPSLQIIPSQQDGIIQTFSENYSWQSRLAEFIYKNTGIRVEQHAYRI